MDCSNGFVNYGKERFYMQPSMELVHQLRPGVSLTTGNKPPVIISASLSSRSVIAETGLDEFHGQFAPATARYLFRTAATRLSYCVLCDTLQKSIWPCAYTWATVRSIDRNWLIRRGWNYPAPNAANYSVYWPITRWTRVLNLGFVKGTLSCIFGQSLRKECHIPFRLQSSIKFSGINPVCF